MFQPVFGAALLQRDKLQSLSRDSRAGKIQYEDLVLSDVLLCDTK